MGRDKRSAALGLWWGGSVPCDQRSERKCVDLAHTVSGRGSDYHRNAGAWCIQSGEVGGRNAECGAGIVRHRNDHSLFMRSQGATLGIPVTARVLGSGLPRSGVQVNFAIQGGTGSLSAASAQTNLGGYATVTLSLTAVNSPVNVSACVAPANSPCSMVYVNTVALAQQKLEQVSGAGQISTGAPFQPVVVRVTNSASPPNPVLGATVSFLTTVLRQGESSTSGEPQNPAMPVILKVTESSALTDINGLASIVPGSAGFSAPVAVDLSVSAGSSAFLNDPLFMLPAPAGGSGSGRSSPPARHPILGPVGREW